MEKLISLHEAVQRIFSTMAINSWVDVEDRKPIIPINVVLGDWSVDEEDIYNFDIWKKILKSFEIQLQKSDACVEECYNVCIFGGLPRIDAKQLRYIVLDQYLDTCEDIPIHIRQDGSDVSHYVSSASVNAISRNKLCSKFLKFTKINEEIPQDKLINDFYNVVRIEVFNNIKVHVLNVYSSMLEDGHQFKCLHTDVETNPVVQQSLDMLQSLFISNENCFIRYDHKDILITEEESILLKMCRPNAN